MKRFQTTSILEREVHIQTESIYEYGNMAICQYMNISIFDSIVTTSISIFEFVGLDLRKTYKHTGVEDI